MKKKINIVLVIILCLIFTGCNKSKNIVNTDNASEASITSSNYKSDIMTYENVRYQVTNVGRSQGSEYDKPSEGKEYIIVTIKITNDSSSTIKYNAMDWKLADDNNGEVGESFTIVDKNTTMGNGSLEAGKSIEKTITFEKELNSANLKLRLYKNILEKTPSLEIPIK